MELEFALDELYASGWTALDTAGCSYGADGRAYPSVETVGREFDEAGFDLKIEHIQLFDCHRAEWRDRSGSDMGAVVGRSEAEAAVYALAQLRRSLLSTADTA